MRKWRIVSTAGDDEQAAAACPFDYLGMRAIATRRPLDRSLGATEPY